MCHKNVTKHDSLSQTVLCFYSPVFLTVSWVLKAFILFHSCRKWHCFLRKGELLRAWWTPVCSIACDAATVSPLTEGFIPPFCSVGSDVGHEEDSRRRQTHTSCLSLSAMHMKRFGHSREEWCRRPRAVGFPPRALRLNPPANLQLKWW